MGSPIALLTDFGLIDPYVGIVKGVILTISPNSPIIDLTHNVPAQDITQAAFMLGESYQYLPANSVIMAVVDPGVGTERRKIIVQTKKYLFVAPDNGLLTFPIKKEEDCHCFEIKNSKYFLKPTSATFHGRDIFAPVAAYLAQGEPPQAFGSEIKDPTLLSITEPEKKKGEISGQIIHIDNFGNLITNIPATELKELQNPLIKIKGKTIPLKNTYGNVPSGSLVALIGSANLLEIAVNQGNASQVLGAAIGDKVTVIYS